MLVSVFGLGSALYYNHTFLMSLLLENMGGKRGNIEKSVGCSFAYD